MAKLTRCVRMTVWKNIISNTGSPKANEGFCNNGQARIEERRSMSVRKIKKVGRWKFQYFFNWPSFGLGFEYKHPHSTFGIALGPFLFTVGRYNK